MNKALKLVRLDFITVKPYLGLKSLLIFVGVALIILITDYSAAAAIGLLMVFAALYVSYPFSVGEKNNIDVLYTILSIKRKTVVLGRYLFSLILDLCAGLFAFIVSFVALTVMQKSFDALESFFVTVILFLIFGVIQAVQLPIYFKLGYAKAKLLAYLPFFVLPLMTLIFPNIFMNVFSAELTTTLVDWLAANLLVTILSAGMIWFAIMAISYKISLSFYRKRDF